jgi:2-amino-4-hydroxy-6-hydroxymethyldihydropteridine diphosphokinase
MKEQVFLGLGSNIGNREEYLQNAITALNSNPDITVLKKSSIYETEPYGNEEQEKFLNMVVQVETSLIPEKLLETTMKIENELGRVRTIRWGPRTIDIDILLYGNRVINTENLTVPHLELTKRAFVLIPLLEIAPDLRLPTGETLSLYLEHLSNDARGVRRM